jgi:hypothetical protein
MITERMFAKGLSVALLVLTGSAASAKGPALAPDQALEMQQVGRLKRAVVRAIRPMAGFNYHVEGSPRQLRAMGEMTRRLVRTYKTIPAQLADNAARGPLHVLAFAVRNAYQRAAYSSQNGRASDSDRARAAAAFLLSGVMQTNRKRYDLVYDKIKASNDPERNQHYQVQSDSTRAFTELLWSRRGLDRRANASRGQEGGER